MQHNCCTFAKIVDGRVSNQGDKCGLYYRTLSELIHHIEEEHIPLIEKAKMLEMKQLKEQFANDPHQYEAAYSQFISQPVPLSLICKLKPFPKGYKVHPIPPPKPRTIKFCHYKPKKQPAPAPTQSKTEIPTNENTQITTGNGLEKSAWPHPSKKLAHAENQARNRQISSSSESATPGPESIGPDQQQQALGTEDKKLFCGIEGCKKTYKNQQGLRHHRKSAHGLSIDSGSPVMPSTKLSASEESILSRQLPGRQSPFIVGKDMPSDMATIRPIEKFQCQHCFKEFKGIKGLANLNKHLHDAHQVLVNSPASSVHSSRYPSPSPMSTQQQQSQQIYSPQQSPQRPISTGNITILPATKGTQFQQGHQTSFVAPTLTSRHQQQSTMLAHQTARPSAPIPPSTPTSGQIHQTMISGYSPQHQSHGQHQQATIIRAQPLEMSPRYIPSDHHRHQEQQHGQAQQPHYYITTQPMDQQPQPLALQSQQQPPASIQPQQRSYHRYATANYQPQSQMAQQKQTGEQINHPHEQQQIYSPAVGPTNYVTYPTSSIGQQVHQGGTTTIYVTQQQQGAMGSVTPGGNQQQYYGVQQMEYEQQQPDSYNRPFYRQQPHYMVEQPIQGSPQHGDIYSHQAHQVQPSSGTRMGSSSSAIRVSNSGQPQQYIQQAGPIQQQQQSHFQTVYAQPRSGIYQQGEPMHHQQQQGHPQQPQPASSPFITTISRTAPIQGSPQRLYQPQQQPQQFYTPSHTRQQRSSPATVAAVLAAASPLQHQGGSSSGMYAGGSGMHRQP